MKEWIMTGSLLLMVLYVIVARFIPAAIIEARKKRGEQDGRQ
ncbi:MAG: hypothetical protein WC248_05050 [Candidatus Methanomethylophilaceae archaeon]